MQNRFTIHGLCVLLCLWSVPAETRELSREQIATLAAHNPQLAAARAQVEAAEGRRGQADAARWPIVSLTAGVGPSQQADLVPGTAVQSTVTTYSFDDLSVVIGGQLEIIQPLFTFGKIDHRRAAAGREIVARQAQARMTHADLLVTVAEIYEGYLFARDAVRFAAEAVEFIEQDIERSEERLKKQQPDISEGDVLQLKSDRDIALMAQHQAEAKQAEALAGLRAYLGIPADEEITVREDELQPFAVESTPLEQLVASALVRRPELTALENGAAALDELAAAEWAGYLPDFFVAVGAEGAYTPGRDLIETRYVTDRLYYFSPRLLLGVRWSLWGPMAGARAAEFRAQGRALEELQVWARQGLPAEVRKEYEEAQRALADIETAQGGWQRAKQWMVMASSDQAVGLAETRAVSDAVEAYARLRLGYLDAVYRRNTSLVRLAKAAGTLLTDGAGPYGGQH